MTISDLSREQKVALVALLERVVAADGVVSAAEEKEIGLIAGELGDDAYRALLDEAEACCPDEQALAKYLSGIREQEARELIYGTVLEEVTIDPAAAHSVSELLDWLAATWGIKVEIQE